MKNSILSRIIDFLMLLPFAYISNYIVNAKTDTVFEIYSIVVFLLIMIIYFKNKKMNIPIIILLIGIMYLIPLLVTIICGDHTVIRKGIKLLIGSVCISMLIDYNMESRPKKFLESIMIFYGTLIIVNTLSFFLFYPSITPLKESVYFLGNDNGSIFEVFLFVYVSLVYYTMHNRKIPIYFYILLSFVFAGYLYVKSGNGMICMLISIIFTVLYKRPFAKKLFKLKFMIPIYLLLFFTIVVFQNNGLIQIVLDMLNKSPTISGRTYIWNKCGYYISQRPLFGNGYENDLLISSKISNSKAHNIILQYLYTGGVATLGVFLLIVGIVLYKTNKSKIDADVKNIINFSIFLFFIMCIFDFYIDKFITIIMFAIYYCVVTTKIKSPK